MRIKGIITWSLFYTYVKGSEHFWRLERELSEKLICITSVFDTEGTSSGHATSLSANLLLLCLGKCLYNLAIFMSKKIFGNEIEAQITSEKIVMILHVNVLRAQPCVLTKNETMPGQVY